MKEVKLKEVRRGTGGDDMGTKCGRAKISSRVYSNHKTQPTKGYHHRLEHAVFSSWWVADKELRKVTRTREV